MNADMTHKAKNPMEEADLHMMVSEEINKLETYKNLFGISMSKSLATERQMMSGSRRLGDIKGSSLLLMQQSTGQLGKLYNQDFMNQDDLFAYEPRVHETL